MQKNLCRLFPVFLFLVITGQISAQKKKLADPSEKLKTQAIADMQSKYNDYKKTALQVWDYAELGY